MTRSERVKLWFSIPLPCSGSQLLTIPFVTCKHGGDAVYSHNWLRDVVLDFRSPSLQVSASWQLTQMRLPSCLVDINRDMSSELHLLGKLVVQHLALLIHCYYCGNPCVNLYTCISSRTIMALWQTFCL